MQSGTQRVHTGREANFGGLSGKARRRRHRSRSQRLFAKQLVDEYLEPKSFSRGDRYIPIRRRSEFLPSAPLPDGVAFVRKEPEGESRAGSDDHAERLVGARAAQRKAAGAIRFGAFATRMTSRATDRVREDCANKATAPTVASSFTPRGFAYGCLFGSAAAAVILLVVQVAV